MCYFGDSASTGSLGGFDETICKGASRTLKPQSEHCLGHPTLAWGGQTAKSLLLS